MGYKEQTYELLKDFKQGLIDDETFLKKLRSSEYTDLGFAMIDHERSLRQGFAEVVYCEGKTAEQTAAIMSRLAEVHSNIIGTRANEEKFAAVKKAVPDAEYYKDAGFIKIERNPLPKDEKRYIAVVTAGTSDLPVSEEAALTAEIMGNTVKRVYDVGVAGIHRLFSGPSACGRPEYEYQRRNHPTGCSRYGRRTGKRCGRACRQACYCGSYKCRLWSKL